MLDTSLTPCELRHPQAFQYITFNGTQQHEIAILELLKDGDIEKYDLSCASLEQHFGTEFKNTHTFELIGKKIYALDLIILDGFKVVDIVPCCDFSHKYKLKDDSINYTCASLMDISLSLDKKVREIPEHEAERRALLKRAIYALSAARFFCFDSESVEIKGEQNNA